MGGRRTEIRTELYSAAELRALACGSASPRRVKRLLALANALDGMSFGRLTSLTAYPWIMECVGK
jgi:hypothetical protein